MSGGLIVIGKGEAGPWFKKAIPVQETDSNLMCRANFCGLFDRWRACGAGRGWLVVVRDDEGIESALEEDPAVIAYCDSEN